MHRLQVHLKQMAMIDRKMQSIPHPIPHRDGIAIELIHKSGCKGGVIAGTAINQFSPNSILKKHLQRQVCLKCDRNWTSMQHVILGLLENLKIHSPTRSLRFLTLL